MRLPVFRLMMVAGSIQYVMGVQPNDILYTALPLYHGSGSMLGFPQALMYGTPVALRKKFSASNFWKDCIKYDCTVYTKHKEMTFSKMNIQIITWLAFLDCPIHRGNL